MSAPDPRVTLTDEERELLGDWWDDPADLGLDHLHPVVERIVAARLAPIRAEAAKAAQAYERAHGEASAMPPGSIGRRLHSALGDLAHIALVDAPSGPESAQQGSGGAEGQGEGLAEVLEQDAALAWDFFPDPDAAIAEVERVALAWMEARRG